MSTDGVDKSKRRFLTNATVVVGAVGTAFVAVPFIKSWNPSERAKAAGAPVEVDISKLQPGQILRVLWRKQPVWIVRRTDQNIADLKALEGELEDPASIVKEQQPDYITGTARSIKEEYFVAVGICTHLGCAPTYRPEVGPADLGADWKGGFFCPCHGSKFDLSGRVYAGVPAPLNLKIPDHVYINDSTLLIGLNKVPV